MAPHDAPSFGEVLRGYRRAAGLTQESLAERAGLSGRTIADLERGVNRTPRTYTVRLLATALSLAPATRDVFEAAASGAARPPIHSPAGPAPMVGRQRHMALVEQHIAGIGPPVLLFSGEPGIGKTRLLQEVIGRAADSGWTVVQGGCYGRGGQGPYAPLLSALERHVRECSALQLRGDLRGCAWLVRLLPELSHGPIEALPAWTLPPEQERRLMWRAVARFLTNIAGPAGTLLVLDDLQWAGADALDLLATLARGATDTGLRIAAAYRDTEVQPRDDLSVMLGDLAHAGLASRHHLGPLTMSQVEQLLDELWTGGGGQESALREQVLRRAGGVPFFVVSCVQALRDGEGAETTAASVPWDVAHSVRQRVAALPEVAREVVGIAAIVGRVAPCALLVRVVPWPEEAVLAALDAACQARLLEEQGAEAYQFAHDVIREVTEGDLGAARRAALHRRVAEALELQPGDPPLARLAYHYTQSGVRDRAALYLERAGDQARAGYANTTAETCYRDATEHLEALGRHVDAARVCEKWGAVLRLMGRYEAARGVFEQAIAAYEAAGDLESMARALAETWLLYQESGTAADGLRRYQAVAERLAPRGPSPGLSALYAAMGVMLLHAEQYAEFLRMADRAVELARGLEDPEIRAEAEVKRGHAMLNMVGRVEEGMRSIEQAIRLGEDAGARMPNLGGWYGMLAGAHLGRGELALSQQLIARGHAVAERQGNFLRLLSTTLAHAEIAFVVGDWAQAQAEYVWARDTSLQLELPLRLLTALLGLGRLALARGDAEVASQALGDAEARATRINHVTEMRLVSLALAERDLRVGRPAAAHARLLPLQAYSDPQERYIDDLPVWLAWATAEVGDLAVAAALIARAIAAIRADNRRLTLVEALRVQALVALKQGCWVEAAPALEEGLRVAREIGYPYAEARLLHICGGPASIQTGPSCTARERLQAALTIFQRLGARGETAQVEQALG